MSASQEALLDSGEWKSLELAKALTELGFKEVSVSLYAVVGIVIVSKTQTIIEIWATCQAEMLTFKKGMGNAKDFYLIFIVPEIDGVYASSLEKILNDTFVCRKICIEQQGRSLKEALRDSGLTAISESNKSIPIDVVEQITNEGFPKGLITDLGSRSAEAIIQKLISNTYEPNETSKS